MAEQLKPKTGIAQELLKTKIATGDFTASEARQYNQMT
jgi:hypothetical protein